MGQNQEEKLTHIQNPKQINHDKNWGKNGSIERRKNVGYKVSHSSKGILNSP